MVYLCKLQARKKRISRVGMRREKTMHSPKPNRKSMDYSMDLICIVAPRELACSRQTTSNGIPNAYKCQCKTRVVWQVWIISTGRVVHSCIMEWMGSSSALRLGHTHTRDVHYTLHKHTRDSGTKYVYMARLWRNGAPASNRHDMWC